MNRPVHPDFQALLDHKSGKLIELYLDLRAFMLDINPEANELLYHTHALTSVYSLSEKLGHGYCHIPIYSEHLNLGFNRGAILPDPDGLLQGTGKWIRHIPVRESTDYRNDQVRQLVEAAIAVAREDLDGKSAPAGKTISKISN